jgi:hypothetical protein
MGKLGGRQTQRNRKRRNQAFARRNTGAKSKLERQLRRGCRHRSDAGVPALSASSSHSRPSKFTLGMTGPKAQQT